MMDDNPHTPERQSEDVFEGLIAPIEPPTPRTGLRDGGGSRNGEPIGAGGRVAHVLEHGRRSRKKHVIAVPFNSMRHV
jgi:hypothetical protein